MMAMDEARTQAARGGPGRPVRVALAVIGLNAHARAWRGLGGWRRVAAGLLLRHPLGPEQADTIARLLLELQGRAEWLEGWREGVRLGADLDRMRGEGPGEGVHGDPGRT